MCDYSVLVLVKGRCQYDNVVCWKRLHVELFHIEPTSPIYPLNIIMVLCHHDSKHRSTILTLTLSMCYERL